MDTFSPSCQLLYKMTLLSDQRFEQSVCLLWFRPCHFVSEPPFVFHQDSGLVWDPSSAPGNNIWWWWRSLRDSILMCDPSCALGNDRAAGISFIHEHHDASSTSSPAHPSRCIQLFWGLYFLYCFLFSVLVPYLWPVSCDLRDWSWWYQWTCIKSEMETRLSISLKNTHKCLNSKF